MERKTSYNGNELGSFQNLHNAKIGRDIPTICNTT